MDAIIMSLPPLQSSIKWKREIYIFFVDDIDNVVGYKLMIRYKIWKWQPYSDTQFEY